MRHRKLRIAWSVLWGVACVLIFGLWVRSYWQYNGAVAQITSTKALMTKSNLGYVQIETVDLPGLQRKTMPWRYETGTAIRFDEGDLSRFYFRRFSEHLEARIPYWCFTSVCVGLVAVPWVRWRFGVRTLLIATTLIAVLLGLAVYGSR